MLSRTDASTLSNDLGFQSKGCATSFHSVMNAAIFALEIGKALEGSNADALTLEAREPLLDLVHPRAVHRGVVHVEARVRGEPRANELAAVGNHVVADEVDRRDGIRRATIDLLEELDELDHPLAAAADADDLTGPRVERGQQVERARANVLVLDANGHAVGSRGAGCVRSGSRLDRGLLVEREHALVGGERSRVEVADVADARGEGLVSLHLRAHPVMDAPRLQLVRREDPLDRLRRDRLHDPIANRRARQLRARPQRQRTIDAVRKLARELDDLHRDYRGEKRAARPFVERHPNRGGAFGRTAPPTCGRCVAVGRGRTLRPRCSSRRRGAG
jgi:hypothetical protein